MTPKTIFSAAFAASISLLALAGGAGDSLAGGGFSTRSESVNFSSARPSQAAAASDSVTVSVAGEGFAYQDTLTAVAIAATVVPGQAVFSGASTSASYQAMVDGPLSVTVTSYGVTFTRGTNSITKSRTETQANLVVNGRGYVVADDVAIAVGRATQFGSTAGAGTSVNVSSNSNGYSPDPTVTTKAGIR